MHAYLDLYLKGMESAPEQDNGVTGRCSEHRPVALPCKAAFCYDSRSLGAMVPASGFSPGRACGPTSSWAV